MSDHDKNPESIKVGDTVWLKSDVEQKRPMQVASIQTYFTGIDIVLDDIDPDAPLEADCVWVDGGKDYKRSYVLSDLTKIRKRKWWKFWTS